MSSIDLPAAAVRTHAAMAVARPAHRRFSLFRVLGGFVLTGFFLALSAATLPVVAVYSFIWWAQLY